MPVKVAGPTGLPGVFDKNTALDVAVSWGMPGRLLTIYLKGQDHGL